MFLSLSYDDKVIQLLFNGILLECRRLCSQVRHLLVRKGQVSAAKHIQTYPNIRYFGFEGSPRDPGKDRSIFERTVDSRLQSKAGKCWQDVTDIKNDPWITYVSPICNMWDSQNQTSAVVILVAEPKAFPRHFERGSGEYF